MTANLSPVPARTNANLGLALIFAFSALTAAKEVYAANILQTESPFALLFYSFVLVTFTAALDYTIRFKRHDTVVVWPWFSLILLNVSAATSWIGFFYAMKYVEPVIVSSIITAIGPGLTILFSKIAKRPPSSRPEIIAAIGMAACVIYLAYASANGSTGIVPINRIDVFAGLLAAFAAGAAFALTTVAAKGISEKGWSAPRVLAFRYLGVVLISGLIMVLEGPTVGLLVNHAGAVILIAAFGLIMPLYCLQYGIQYCSPQSASMVMAMGPALTFILEAFDPRISWSRNTLIGVMLLVMFGLYGVVYPRLTARTSRLTVARNAGV